MSLILAIIMWSGGAALVFIVLAGLELLADVFLLPRWTPSRLFRPVCAVLGHTDEDMDEDEQDVGVCQRCGGVFWPLGKP